MSAKTPLPSFAAAVSQMVVRAASIAYPTDYIVEHILKLSNYLIDIAGSSNLFGKPELDLYSPSLNTLFARLQKKQLSPSLLPSGFLTVERIHARIYLRSDKEAADRPLADYEDLYYALVSRMQEIHQLLNLRLDSGFNVATESIYEGGPSIADFHNSLSEYWDVLNHPSCGKALDDAIREARLQALRYELVYQVQSDNISTEDAHKHLAELNSSDVYTGILGLNFVQDWAPPMIGAHLETKYRQMLNFEKQEAKLKTKQERRNAKLKVMREAREARRAASPAKKTKTTTHRQARAVRKSAHALDMKTRIEAEHQYIPKDLAASMRQSPEYRAEIHPGYYYDAHTATIEENIAEAEDMVMQLEWQMKAQRVMEYSLYLRTRASQDSQFAVQSSQGSVMDSFID